MASLQAVLFDLDDTLYPEREYVRSGFQAAAAWAETNLGIESQSGFAELWGYFESGVRGNTYNLWLEAHGIEAAKWIPELVAVYREHIPDIKPHPGVLDLLKALEATYHLGVITEGHVISQRNKLDALGLSAMFEVVVITGMDERDYWKPHARPFTKALESLDVKPGQSMYIGDNPRKDFFGARRLGMHTVRVLWPGGLNTPLQPESPTYDADYSIENLNQLPGILASLEEGS